MHLPKYVQEFAIAAFLSICSGAAFCDVPPSFETVQLWWRSTHTEPVKVGDVTLEPEDIDTDGDPVEIHLIGGEKAYLYPVNISQRGRNDTIHTVMARPKLKEVREVAEPVERNLEVHDFAKSGVSEVVTTSIASGGGSTDGAQSIVQFQGWKAIVLHSIRFGNNEGEWGKQDKRYWSKSVSWKFVDLDNNGIDDLVETITIEKGRKNTEPLKTTVTHKYLFKNNRYIRQGD
ncbi:MAG: hypothetical protein ACXU8A_05560 [Burkholderiaceae bacterium]